MEISAHEQIELTGLFDPFMKQNGLSWLCVPWTPDAYFNIQGVDGHLSISRASPFDNRFPQLEDEWGSLTLGYLYRDASNYKIGSEVKLRGYLTPIRSAVIFSALTLHGGDFIPSEIGLDDLQANLPGEPDFSEDGDDHPYHELTEISFAQAAKENCGEDEIAGLYEECLARLKEAFPS